MARASEFDRQTLNDGAPAKSPARKRLGAESVEDNRRAGVGVASHDWRAT